MFSIAAINDTESRSQWEPLAPTKEAQEFHLSQTYHEGLLKLEAKEYGKARELLESVLKDPLVANAEVDGNASDGHLLQLRFLALKNLATVFLQQGSSYYENALCCYLQAVEIDSKDSVVWNQLGTLSCSMSLLSISRWAFEQGLLCSPNNWNCMEKLLEVLIAIGDEVACLSIAELILRHWPSHSRSLHVKSTIQESEPTPLAPRGIDKLEPKHGRLKFPDKRKATNENLDEVVASKKLKTSMELQLTEASWVALADALLEILLSLSVQISEMQPEIVHRSGDIRLVIILPPTMDSAREPAEGKGQSAEHMNFGDCHIEKASIVKEKEESLLDEQPHERRSSRLERLRSRRPGKEESDSVCGKNQVQVVSQYLEPFITGPPCRKDTDYSESASNLTDTEYSDFSQFLNETSKNYGAYHMTHLLLEEISKRGLRYQDALVKFLELEKLTRDWGKDRTVGCSLFLAELYYDFGLRSGSASKQSEFMSEASYHLCKIIESIALDDPHNLSCILGKQICSSDKIFEENTEITNNNMTCNKSFSGSSCLTSNSSFWIRYFWLSGRLSILDGNKAKSDREFCISLSLLAKKENMDASQCSVRLLHCKVIKELSIDRILYEINMLKVDLLMEKSAAEMIEKEKYLECVSSLAPLLFSTRDANVDALSLTNVEMKHNRISSTELSALNILMGACQKTEPMDIEVYLNCHRRKLQILVAATGLDECRFSNKAFHQKPGLSTYSNSDSESAESSSKQCTRMIAEAVVELSHCVSQVKSVINSFAGLNGTTGLISIIGDIQSLLLSILGNVANILLKKSSASVSPDQSDSCCFIAAAVAFCKLQHLNPIVPVKSQVDLIVATHDLLSEFGLCCAGEGSGVEEGTFLRFAIKHLLTLDVKLKSNFNPPKRETAQCEDKVVETTLAKTSLNESQSVAIYPEINQNKRDETIASNAEKEASEGLMSTCILSQEDHDKSRNETEYGNHDTADSDGRTSKGENHSYQLTASTSASELAEDEREELESKIDNALDQCFFCLYGLNLRSDSSYDDDLVMHRNTSRGDYQTREQCADVFQYILPYAKGSSRTGLVKLRRVLRAIRKHFPQPPEDVLARNPIDKFLDDPGLCEDKLSEEAGSDGFLETITKVLFPDVGGITQYESYFGSSEPYLDVYCNLYYFLALSEEMSATDKWPGFVLTKEGEEFVQQNANLFKYDLVYNPMRFQSWQRLANIYDEEVDLLLNDGSKHINVAGWRKNATLPQRVEASRRRSRRCLLMGLALAKTSTEQCEIHELLALVYYDSLQNVVPFYDQRSITPSKDAEWLMFCENSMKHFKKAFAHKQDWSHAFYLGKLCEKLGYSHDIALSYYDKAITLNSSAVDPVYRMHASRLKLLYSCGKQNLEVLKVLSMYSFNESLRESVMSILGETDSTLDSSGETRLEGSVRLEEAWCMLYNDCLSAIETCVEGDLKHFHKARYMLAQGLHRRGQSGDLERARNELSFCFKSSRSSFTINMWEIDSMVKKGRRKTPGSSGNKKALEVNLPESSRKFITCIRKYLLFYLNLLEETGDICTLDRAITSLRSDKRFSLCIEDLLPIALGRYVKALIASIHLPQDDTGATSSSENVLEKLFTLFMEQGNLWPDMCSLQEIKSPDITENGLYGYLHEYITLLEMKGKLEAVEAINEKIRKRFKNPKLSTSSAKVCRHASLSWSRSLINSLALITPLQPGFSNEIQACNSMDGGMNYSQLLCVDLQMQELWNSVFEDVTQVKKNEAKWGPVLSKIKNIVIRRASDENLEIANSLLRSSFNFYRESSCVMLTSGVNLYLVPSRVATGIQINTNMDGVETLDLSIPRKLLLWAYTLLHGRCANISTVVKYCEENAKSKMKRGSGISSASSNALFVAPLATGGGKDSATSGGGGCDVEPPSISGHISAFLSSGSASHAGKMLPPGEIQKSSFASPQLHQCDNSSAERSNSVACEGDPNKG